jgi:hypothetical protein
MRSTKKKIHRKRLTKNKVRKNTLRKSGNRIQNKIKKVIFRKKGGEINITLKKSKLGNNKTVGKIKVGNDFPLNIDERLLEIKGSIHDKHDPIFTKTIQIEKLD